MTAARLTRLRELLQERRLDAVMISNPVNRAYLSGFVGTSGTLLITSERALLLTDFRYAEQAADQAPDFEVVKCPIALAEVARLAQSLALRRLGFEGGSLSYDEYGNYAQALTGVDLISVSGALDQFRLIKDESEIGFMQKAAEIADQAWSELVGMIKPGVVERDLSLELEYRMKRLGAAGVAFDIIVASGVRSALPHGVASGKTVAAGELVTFDFGAVYQGYHSDMTRTVMVGEPSAKQREIYGIVLEAQQRGVAACRAGITGAQLDEVCRGYIREHGYAEAFGHGTGHGVGLEIHEAPRLRAGSEQTLEPGMVVTIEPGIYLSGWGGVRIEDMVLVTDQGCKSFSKSPKDLLIL